MRLSEDGDAIRVAPVGELDLATAGRLRDEVRRLVDSGFRHVVIDLDGLSFIDCWGLQLLLDLTADADHRSWRLSLVERRGSARRLFAVTGTLEVLPFV